MVTDTIFDSYDNLKCGALLDVGPAGLYGLYFLSLTSLSTVYNNQQICLQDAGP